MFLPTQVKTSSQAKAQPKAVARVSKPKAVARVSPRSQRTPGSGWHRSARNIKVGESSHVKNKIAGRIILFLVLGFWDKNTGIFAGAMPYRRDFPATTRIYAFQAKKRLFCVAVLMLAW